MKTPRVPDIRAFSLYSDVRLSRDLNVNGHAYRKGIVGQIVHIHDDGAGYEIDLPNADWPVTVLCTDLAAP